MTPVGAFASGFILGAFTVMLAILCMAAQEER